MKRNHVTAVATSITLALAAGAAFAQAGPDFSPMKPDNFDELRSQSTPSPEPAQLAPGYEAPATPPPNRMLDAYESSAVPPDTVAAAPYEPSSRPRIAVVPPRQSTIGNGLFDRRGPNDFGS
jgi:hypothetical protein